MNKKQKQSDEKGKKKTQKKDNTKKNKEQQNVDLLTDNDYLFQDTSYTSHINDQNEIYKINLQQDKKVKHTNNQNSYQTHFEQVQPANKNFTQQDEINQQDVVNQPIDQNNKYFDDIITSYNEVVQENSTNQDTTKNKLQQKTHCMNDPKQEYQISNKAKNIDPVYEEEFKKWNSDKSSLHYNPNIEKEPVPYDNTQQNTFSQVPDEFTFGKLNKHIVYIKDPQKQWPMHKVDIYCFNCCQPFDNIPVGIPVKFQKGTFHLEGNFCSFSCTLRAIMEQNKTERYEYIHLLQNLYLFLTKKTQIIQPAPNKQILKIFGGKKSIEEYRQENIQQEVNPQQEKIIYSQLQYPIVPSLSFIEKQYDSLQYDLNQSIQKNK